MLCLLLCWVVEGGQQAGGARPRGCCHVRSQAKLSPTSSHALHEPPAKQRKRLGGVVRKCCEHSACLPRTHSGLSCWEPAACVCRHGAAAGYQVESETLLS